MLTCCHSYNPQLEIWISKSSTLRVMLFAERSSLKIPWFYFSEASFRSLYILIYIHAAITDRLNSIHNPGPALDSKRKTWAFFFLSFGSPRNEGRKQRMKQYRGSKNMMKALFGSSIRRQGQTSTSPQQGSPPRQPLIEQIVHTRYVVKRADLQLFLEQKFPQQSDFAIRVHISPP